jgi:hypothetical protein
MLFIAPPTSLGRSRAMLSNPLLISALITAGTVLRWAGGEQRALLTPDPYAGDRERLPATSAGAATHIRIYRAPSTSR